MVLELVLVEYTGDQNDGDVFPVFFHLLDNVGFGLKV